MLATKSTRSLFILLLLLAVSACSGGELDPCACSADEHCVDGRCVPGENPNPAGDDGGVDAAKDGGRSDRVDAGSPAADGGGAAVDAGGAAVDAGASRTDAGGGRAGRPTCRIHASPTLVCEEADSTVSWESTGETCELRCGEGPARNVSCRSSEALGGLEEASTCTLTARGPGGETSCSTAVSVQRPPSRCSVDMSREEACAGNSVTVTWLSDGETCESSCDGGVTWAPIACSGSLSLTPGENLGCALRARNECGSITCSDAVEVTSCSASYSPSSIEPGADATITWAAVNADECEYECSNNPGVWTPIECNGSAVHEDLESALRCTLRATADCGTVTCGDTVTIR